MKYGYIPIDPIVSEVLAKFKTLSKMGKLDEDDCYQYAVQCLRKIGCTEFDTNEEIIHIKKHKAAIPKHFYIFSDVRLAEKINFISPLNTTPTEVTKNEFKWNGDDFKLGKSLKPVDSVSLTFCDTQFYNKDCSEIGFSFKIPPGVLSCDLRDCLLYVKFHGLKRDECGNYMIQDEENGIEAVKNFILQEALHEDYVMGKLQRYIYKDIENKFDESLSCAQSALLALGPAEVNAMVNHDRRKFDKFKLT